MNIEVHRWTKIGTSGNADFYEIEPQILAVVPFEGSTDDGIATAHEFLDQSGQSLGSRQVTAERGATTSTLTVAGDVVSVVPGLNLRIEVTVDAPTERVIP